MRPQVDDRLETEATFLTLAESQLALAALASLCAGERSAIDLLRKMLRRVSPLAVPQRHESYEPLCAGEGKRSRYSEALAPVQPLSGTELALDRRFARALASLSALRTVPEPRGDREVRTMRGRLALVVAAVVVGGVFASVAIAGSGSTGSKGSSGGVAMTLWVDYNTSHCGSPNYTWYQITDGYVRWSRADTSWTMKNAYMDLEEAGWNCHFVPMSPGAQDFSLSPEWGGCASTSSVYQACTAPHDVSFPYSGPFPTQYGDESHNGGIAGAAVYYAGSNTGIICAAVNFTSGTPSC